VFEHRRVDICEYDSSAFADDTRKLARQVAGAAGKIENDLPRPRGPTMRANSRVRSPVPPARSRITCPGRAFACWTV